MAKGYRLSAFRAVRLPRVRRAASGQRLTLRAQGIDETPVVTIDGRRARVLRRIGQSAVEVRVSKLARGPHDVSLRIGNDLGELKRGAIVVR